MIEETFINYILWFILGFTMGILFMVLLKYTLKGRVS